MARRLNPTAKLYGRVGLQADAQVNAAYDSNEAGVPRALCPLPDRLFS